MNIKTTPSASPNTASVPPVKRTMSVWNLMYVAGNPSMMTKVISNADNPMRRSDALRDGEKVGNNDWRVWVEHATTGERIYESPAEVKHRVAAERKRIIDFAADLAHDAG